MLGCVVAGDGVKRRVQEQMELWDVTPSWVVTSAQEAGLTNGYDHPSRLGPDRWVAMIGARHRMLGQGAPRPMVVVLLGTAVQNSLIGEDTSLLGGLILAATLLSLNWTVGKLSSRSQRFHQMVEGKSVILVHRGHLFRDELARQSMSEEDFAIARRSAGYATVGEIALAVLESSGEITFVRRKERDASDGQ